jgi:hypothetical protein
VEAFDKYHADLWFQDGLKDKIEIDGHALTPSDILVGELSPLVAREDVTVAAGQTIENYLLERDELLAQRWRDEMTYRNAVDILAPIFGVEREAIAS